MAVTRVSFGVMTIVALFFFIVLPAVQAQTMAPAPAPTSDGYFLRFEELKCVAMDDDSFVVFQGHLLTKGWKMGKGKKLEKGNFIDGVLQIIGICGGCYCGGVFSGGA
ncbi:hypothetical protein HHK36_000101 [Tetracentron sinense]|uniref:Uncharacterized protein n=1 Tax=Tetracentron sinense TaxID=13715 RepID=A0A834ZRC3_TETSI|nr:hypothetical protein HHK36_000101 [Tetracentron sinense]